MQMQGRVGISYSFDGPGVVVEQQLVGVIVELGELLLGGAGSSLEKKTRTLFMGDMTCAV